MSNNTIKLQVPMDKEVREALEKKARGLGFDSAQAYIRVWAKAETEGRQITFGEDDWGQPSDAAAERLNRWSVEAKSDLKAGKLKSFDDPREALDYLNSL